MPHAVHFSRKTNSKTRAAFHHDDYEVWTSGLKNKKETVIVYIKTQALHLDDNPSQYKKECKKQKKH
ncbi:hypothetical protein XFPR_12395 [Xylella fastidiosa]|uniref:Uncharacterized protein n=2 Tax=Xylella fastidiosa TaxID=2371 RepID=A0ABD7BYG2_XYLFS|nr:hypothetical protein [Xylella fastidiosa]AAF83257.1 hypothetical protein XF_0447 [Xylella fastidiosa 9a5c]MDG5823538.1 hypothetical protein [Xylella fastidiosa subsp. pauca]MDG5826813.1 hypothetical protein [Xylella fastidiosa subsp. pauca]QPB72645.1 hypothetical protein XFHB_13340 [Xylella fastidiosa]QPB72982.1 hypothetical protein XFPR_12395 [Xylella fastidiosa]